MTDVEKALNDKDFRTKFQEMFNHTANCEVCTTITQAITTLRKAVVLHMKENERKN